MIEFKHLWRPHHLPIIYINDRFSHFAASIQAAVILSSVCVPDSPNYRQVGLSFPVHLFWKLNSYSTAMICSFVRAFKTRDMFSKLSHLKTHFYLLYNWHIERHRGTAVISLLSDSGCRASISPAGTFIFCWQIQYWFVPLLFTALPEWECVCARARA